MTTNGLEWNVIGFPTGMHGCGVDYTAAFLPRTAVPPRHDAAAAGFTLAEGEMLMLPNEELGILCLAGELWLTRTNDIEDHILGPGHCFRLRRGEQGAVQALKPSRLSLLSCARSAPKSGAKACKAAPRPKQQSIMAGVDLGALERQAHRLRAEEMLRIGGLIAARLRRYGHLLWDSAESAAQRIGKRLRCRLFGNCEAQRCC